MPDSSIENKPELAQLIEAYAQGEDGHELFVFSAAITQDNADRIMSLIDKKADWEKPASLFITTFGGDPHAAFRVCRYFQDHFKSLRVLIAGDCKSAGTLVALVPAGSLGRSTSNRQRKMRFF